MRIVRLVLGLLVVAGLATPIPVPAAFAGDPAKQPLKSTNKITSRGSGSLDVSIPAGAVIDLREDLFRTQGPNAGFSMSRASGPFAGLILQPLKPNRMFSRITLGRFDPCKTSKCRLPIFNYVSPAAGGVFFDTGERIPRFLELPAGTYRLFVIGRGRTTVVLRLQGLKGSGTFDAGTHAAADIQHLPSRLATQGGDYAFASGATFDSGISGLFIANFFVKGRGIENFDWGICAYNGPDAPPEEIAYGPHCTALVRAMGAGFSGRFAELDQYSENGFFVARLQSTYEPDHFPPNVSSRRGLGAWYLTPSNNVEVAGAEGVYLRFD